jgi:hypothetical protein
VYVKWDDEEETASVDQGDARYAVDRGKWRILAPRIGDPLSGERGVSLTTLAESARIEASANAGGSTDRGDDEDMAREQSNAAAEREAAQKALKNGEFKERETYTAKQVAGRCGTDAKTMRKFFRSKASTVEPVGQGGRYEFAAEDLPKIKREFDAWRKKADSRAGSSPINTPAKQALQKRIREVKDSKQFTPTTGDHDTPTPKATPPSSAARTLLEESPDKVEEAVHDHFGDDHEPTDEELEEMAKLMAGDFESDSPWEPHPDLADLDLDDFDAEEVED